MAITEEKKYNNIKTLALIQGNTARIKHSGEIVELKRVSEFGISVVSFCNGGDCFISNNYLEPVWVVH